MTTIGSNRFKNVLVPLAIDDRYFLVEDVDGKDIWTVLTIVDGKLIVEILKNQPHQNSISTVTTNPTGIITVAEPSSGAFLYKVRPGSRNSSIFGKLKGMETEIRITDREVWVGTNVFQKNVLSGVQVGIKVEKDGSILVGTGLPSGVKELIST